MVFTLRRAYDWFDVGASDIIEGALWVHKAADLVR